MRVDIATRITSVGVSSVTRWEQRSRRIARLGMSSRLRTRDMQSINETGQGHGLAGLATDLDRQNAVRLSGLLMPSLLTT